MTGWTDERVATAKTRWVEGRSATEIAKEIGGGLSRNAVIGKVHRLGLTRDERAKATAAASARTQRQPRAPRPPRPVRPVGEPRPAHRAAASLNGGLKSGTDFIETPSSKEQRARFRKQGLSIVQQVEQGCGVESPDARPFLQGRDCKWPLAGGLVCCNPIARGVYCEGHAAVAYLGDTGRTPSYALIAMVNKTERIDLEPDHRVKSGAHVAANDASPWDSGRDAA